MCRRQCAHGRCGRCGGAVWWEGGQRVELLLRLATGATGLLVTTATDIAASARSSTTAPRGIGTDALQHLGGRNERKAQARSGRIKRGAVAERQAGRGEFTVPPFPSVVSSSLPPLPPLSSLCASLPSHAAPHSSPNSERKPWQCSRAISNWEGLTPNNLEEIFGYAAQNGAKCSRTRLCA
jgi:hypothetical protein